MKKVLVSLAVITVLAACGDSSTSSTDVKKDTSVTTSTMVDSSKMKMGDSTMMHKDSTTMKMDTTTHK